MKKHILINCLLLLCLTATAQKKWTLREAVDYAVQNNIELRQQELNVKSADIDLSTSRNSRLPNLSASAGQSFGFGQNFNNATNTYISSNGTGSDFSLSTNMPLFTGFRIPNEIKRDELNLKAAIEGLNKARENLELQVVSLYLDALFKKEILKAYQEQLTLSNQQVERTQILVESGKVPASQLYDIRAQAAKDELNVTMARNDRDLSLLNLSQALNLQEQAGFDIIEPDTDNFIENNMSSVMPVDDVYRIAVGIKPQIREAEYKIESSIRTIKIAQSGYWPTLNFNAGLRTSYNKNFNQPSRPFFRQIDGNLAESFSFSLSIPIFNRFQTRNQVRAARLNTENLELAMDNIKLALYKEIQQAYQSATSAQAKFNSTEKALDAAQESFKYARERYDVGKSTVFEYNEAQTKLLTSKSEQIQAKYDFIFRAKILDFYQGKEIDIQ